MSSTGSRGFWAARSRHASGRRAGQPPPRRGGAGLAGRAGGRRQPAGRRRARRASVGPRRDRLDGGTGNDRLDGGAEARHALGGDGNDTPRRRRRRPGWRAASASTRSATPRRADGAHPRPRRASGSTPARPRAISGRGGTGVGTSPRRPMTGDARPMCCGARAGDDTLSAGSRNDTLRAGRERPADRRAPGRTGRRGVLAGTGPLHRCGTGRAGGLSGRRRRGRSWARPRARGRPCQRRGQLATRAVTATRGSRISRARPCRTRGGRRRAANLIAGLRADDGSTAAPATTRLSAGAGDDTLSRGVRTDPLTGGEGVDLASATTDRVPLRVDMAAPGQLTGRCVGRSS